MDFWRGFRAGSPMWLAALPFAVAYVVATEGAGVNPWESLGMSLLLFSASAQIVIVQSQAAPVASLILSIFLMHLHYFLYGLSLSKQIRMKGHEKALAAYALTDFGFAMSQGENAKLAFLFGIELSVFLAWNINTGLALVMKSFLAGLGTLRLDFIIPLGFFALLVANIKGRVHLLVAIFALSLTAVAFWLGFASYTSVFVILVTPLFGAGLKRLWS